MMIFLLSVNVGTVISPQNTECKYHLFIDTVIMQMHRNERFSADFLYRIQNLVQVLCPYLIQKYKEMPVETQELNRSLANFLKVFFILIY